MKRTYKKIKQALIKRLAHILYREFENIKFRQQPSASTYKFKKFGPNSFFWGQNHLVTGAENFEIGENVHINDSCFIRAEGGVSIGDNTHISRNLVLYSINHDYKGNALPYDDKMIHKKVSIGKNVWIGMNVCIAPGTTIGDGCIIGMGATISGNIPPLSIVGNPKAVIIGQRDENHYNTLETAQKYGAENGYLYKWGEDGKLEKLGDKYSSSRSTSELIEKDGKLYIKKTFIDTIDSTSAFKTEAYAYKRFQKYSWCPKLIEQGADYLITEYLPNEYRLDQYKGKKDKSLLGEILWCILDIYNEGFAHRDIHSKNIFVTNTGIKIIDFETIIPQEKSVDFYESYDITGLGLESPYQTQNMGIMNKLEYSFSSIFNIKSVDEIKAVLNERVKQQMLDSSITFQSKRYVDSRHTLQTSNIYSTFNLKHIKVSAENGQRNTLKRFERFGITDTLIKNKIVLDIGSNIGGTLLGIADRNPLKMIGWEYDADKVNTANKLAGYNGIHNVEFICKDIETIVVNDKLPQFDVVFCLAVVEHLKNKEHLFKILGKVCGQILFFEGNAHTDIDFVTEQLKLNGFSKIDYLGFSDDEKNQQNNNRPLFIANR